MHLWFIVMIMPLPCEYRGTSSASVNGLCYLKGATAMLEVALLQLTFQKATAKVTCTVISRSTSYYVSPSLCSGLHTNHASWHHKNRNGGEYAVNSIRAKWWVAQDRHNLYWLSWIIELYDCIKFSSVGGVWLPTPRFEQPCVSCGI